MTRTLARGGLAALALVVLCACAERPGGGDAGQGVRPPASAAPPGDLVLQVTHVGGFVTPEMTATRLPLVSVYADGRLISEGPVPAIYPGPALPNVQVTEVDEATVAALVEEALAAGVAETGDLGSPPIADAPSTRFTLVTAEGTHVREVYALLEGAAEGLTAEQREGRAALSALLETLTTAAAGESRPYTPTAVAVVTRQWAETDADPDLPQPEVTWPGPALPGETLEPMLGLGCLTVVGPEATAVLEAAAGANTRTPWVSADGSRWALAFRPLLPSEIGCGDLRD